MRCGCAKPARSQMTPESVAHQVVAALIGDRATVATAESLTGGLIGATITAVPGASRAYLGGLVVYATPLKHSLGGVDQAVLDTYGAVSSQTAVELAQGVRDRTGADWGIAVTGVAGPDSQEGQRPGTVWLALTGPQRRGCVKLLALNGDREQIRVQTVDAALSELLALLGGSSSSS